MKLFENLLRRKSEEEKFADQLIKALAAAGDTRRTTYDANHFQILFSSGDGAGGSANLRNIYDEFCGVPKANRKVFLKHIVRALLSHHKELPTDFADAQCDLLPTVRNRSYYELTYLQRRIDGDTDAKWPYQELGDHLGASVVYDLPESMRAVQQDDLDSWQVTFYEAMEVARENLNDMEFSFASVDDRIYVSATNDNYDASRMLLLDRIMQLDIQGDFVAMVPNRDTLLLTGSEDPEGLAMMVEIAGRAFEEAPRPLTATAVRLDGDRWLPWMPPAHHPQFQSFKMLEVKSTLSEYADQKELLAELYQRRGEDVYLAEFSAMQNNQSGQITSYCVWSESVSTLLPRADKVLFYRGGSAEDGKIVASGDWDRVRQIVGDLMTPLDTYPIRFSVHGFPSKAQLDAIGFDEICSAVSI